MKKEEVKEVKKEDVNSKENVLRRFAEISRDNSIPDDVKRARKELMTMETFLEIRDLLRDLNKS